MTKIQNKKFKKLEFRILNLFVTCFLGFVIFGFNEAIATVFYFSPPAINTTVNDKIEVFLMLDTEGERVNAVEGNIIFSKDKLGLVDIGYEDSIINLWIEEPKLEEGKIIFAGITPGGFDGVREPFQKEVESGKILTLVFKAKNVGSGAVVLENARALLNDGEGTETDISLIPFSVDILGKKEPSKTIGFTYVIIITLGLLFIYMFVLWRRKKS